MTYVYRNMARAFLSILALIGILDSSNVVALTCAPLNLDTAFENADSVFVGRLVSASASDDFSAYGELVLDVALKGSSPNKLSFATNIGPLSSCGPDLIIYQWYLVFLKGGKPVLYLINDAISPDRSNDTIRWIERKQQTYSSK